MSGSKATSSELRLPAPWLKALVSLLLLLHLAAVIAAPAAMVPPRSRLAAEIVRIAAPYLQAGNVSHGYAFFAPDPGPSHLIRYVLYWEDGRRQEGTFPDIKRHWPRLRYHRHFMLTDQLAAVAADPEKPPRMSDEPEYVEQWKVAVDEWKRSRARFLAFLQSYAKHLISVHDADSVEIFYIRHDVPLPEDVIKGKSLDDKSLYVTMPSELYPDGPTFTYEAQN